MTVSASGTGVLITTSTLGGSTNTKLAGPGGQDAGVHNNIGNPFTNGDGYCSISNCNFDSGDVNSAANAGAEGIKVGVPNFGSIGTGAICGDCREPHNNPGVNALSGRGPSVKPDSNGTMGPTDPVDEISREIAKVNAAEHAIRLREQQLDIQAMQGGSTLDAFWKNFQRETQHSGLAKQSLIVSSSVELSEIGDETALTTAEHLAEHGVANASSASAATTFEMLGRFIGGTEILVLGPKALGLGIDITNALKAVNDLGSPQ